MLTDVNPVSPTQRSLAICTHFTMLELRPPTLRRPPTTRLVSKLTSSPWSNSGPSLKLPARWCRAKSKWMSRRMEKPGMVRAGLFYSYSSPNTPQASLLVWIRTVLITTMLFALLLFLFLWVNQHRSFIGNSIVIYTRTIYTYIDISWFWMHIWFAKKDKGAIFTLLLATRNLVRGDTNMNADLSGSLC